MLPTAAEMSTEARVQQLLTSVHIEEWLSDDLFQLNWWLLTGLAILATVVWWTMLDKQRLPEIILYAVYLMIVMMGLDEYGEELILWDYPVDIIPVFPVITAVNLLILPMVYSLVYQKFRTWKNFIYAAILATAVVSLVVEPALALGGYYQLLHWEYYYSFPVYIAVALITRWTVIKILAIAEKAQQHHRC